MNDRIAQRLIRAISTLPAVEEAIDLAIIESRMHIRAQNAGAMAMAVTRESNLGTMTTTIKMVQKHG